MIDCNVHGLILEITKTAFSLGKVKMECVDFFSRLTHQRLERAFFLGWLADRLLAGRRASPFSQALADCVCKEITGFYLHNASSIPCIILTHHLANLHYSACRRNLRSKRNSWRGISSTKSNGGEWNVTFWSHRTSFWFYVLVGSSNNSYTEKSRFNVIRILVHFLRCDFVK